MLRNSEINPMNQSSVAQSLETSGYVKAQVENLQVPPGSHRFDSATGQNFLWQSGNSFTVLSRQVFPAGLFSAHTFFFEFSDLTPGGGSRVYDFSDSTSVKGDYSATYLGELKIYTFYEGTVTVALDNNNHLTGSFTGVKGRWNNEVIASDNGTLDLAGLTRSVVSLPFGDPSVLGVGQMHGNFSGGPFPSLSFRSDEVQISRLEGDPDIPLPPYSWTKARQFDQDLPVYNTLVGVFLSTDALGDTFDLAQPGGARIEIHRIADRLFARSISGVLSFTSRPENDRSAGSFDASFELSDGTRFSMKTQFDIYDPK